MIISPHSGHFWPSAFVFLIGGSFALVTCMKPFEGVIQSIFIDLKLTI